MAYVPVIIPFCVCITLHLVSSVQCPSAVSPSSLFNDFPNRMRWLATVVCVILGGLAPTAVSTSTVSQVPARMEPPAL